jgi:2-polyprenyl-3-methyl-5-hydroxy-6-metoxy-1,4-benzoquinol methylase
MRWAEYNKYRKEVSAWLDFRKVPLTTKTSLELALELIPNGAKVLDIGAGNRWLEKELKNRKKKCIYKSMDIDKSYKHDYYNLQKINTRFDFVVMFAVVEHLALEEALIYFKKIARISNNLILTTNNPFFPAGFFFDDVTHKQAYSPRTIYALLRMTGFKEVKVFRISPSKFNTFKTFISYITNLDFAPELFVYAKK